MSPTMDYSENSHRILFTACDVNAIHLFKHRDNAHLSKSFLARNMEVFGIRWNKIQKPESLGRQSRVLPPGLFRMGLDYRHFLMKTTEEGTWIGCTLAPNHVHKCKGLNLLLRHRKWGAGAAAEGREVWGLSHQSYVDPSSIHSLTYQGFILTILYC